MASTINIDTSSDALVVLGTAGVVVPLVRWWGISPILGYLGAGALLGPFGLGSFVGSLPVLYWFTILNDQNVAGIAELGIVFLLFVIGLELSYERLMTMRRLVFGLGSLQVVATTAVIAALALAAGLEGPVAIILGACLALSSTAVVIEVLSSQGRLATSAGRVSFAALLAQDLAVVPILLFISILGAGSGGSILASLATALLHAGAALAAIVIFGRTLLRPLFRLVASVNSSELFIAAILFVIVGAGVVAAQAGLSMALGAFVAGLLLAETEYRKAVEATVEPFKGLLLGLFFFTVGMKIDVRELPLVGNMIYFLLSAFGVGAMIAASAMAFLVIKWAGAAYLLFLGVRALLARPAEARPGQARQLSRHAFVQGLANQLANPKSILFYAAILPQFIDTQGTKLVESLAILAATGVAIEVPVLAAFAAHKDEVTEGYMAAAAT